MQWLLRFVTTWGLRDDWDASRELKRRGIILHPLSGWRVGVVLLVALIVAIEIVREQKPEIIAAILAGGALVLAYVDSMLGRRESSMDKFYERLEIANRHRSDLTHQGMRMIDTNRYVFTELDNLEYVIERYRFGYMSASLAARGLNTFESRFGIDNFYEELCGIMRNNPAYNQSTHAVVVTLIAKHEQKAVVVDTAVAEVG